MPLTKEDYKSLQQIVGVIFLTPAVISVLLFIYAVAFGNGEGSNIYPDLSYSIWTGYTEIHGNYSSGVGGGGYTSALPIYCGLMAMAGVYLIKDNQSIR
jgi:hypothetical protein